MLLLQSCGRFSQGARAVSKDLQNAKAADRAPAKAMVELDAESIAAVAGGLNPQPLPPGDVLRAY